MVWKTSADHVVVEFQRQKTVFRVSATRCCKLPDHGVQEQGVRGVVNYHKVALEEERDTDRKSSFQPKCYIVEFDRTCDEQLDVC